MSYTQADVEMLPISSDVRVAGLGEASRAVARYQQMKADAFRSLVKKTAAVLSSLITKRQARVKLHTKFTILRYNRHW